MRNLLFILALLLCIPSVSFSQTNRTDSPPPPVIYPPFNSGADPTTDPNGDPYPQYDVGGFVNLSPDVDDSLYYQIWPDLDYFDNGIPPDRLADCLADINGARNPIAENIIFEKPIKVGDTVAIDWSTPKVTIKIFGKVKSIGPDGDTVITVTKIQGEYKGVITGLNGPNTDWEILWTVSSGGGPWSVAVCLALAGLYFAGRRMRTVRRQAAA